MDPRCVTDELIQNFFNDNQSSKGDPWGAIGGGLVGAGCVTALIAGGVIVLPAMPVIATGAVVGLAVVGGGVGGAFVGAHLKKPIEQLFEQSPPDPKNFPGTNVEINKYLGDWLGNFGNPAITGLELARKAVAQNVGRPGSWGNWPKQR